MSLFDDISGIANRVNNIHRSYKNYSEPKANLDEIEILQKELNKDPLDEEFEQFLHRDYSILESGDILLVHRSLYDHFGVYIGDGKVIHANNEKVIEETTLDNFKGGLELFVLDFNKLRKIFNNQKLLSDYLNGVHQSKWNTIILSEYHEYSSLDTVKRSLQFIGKTQPNIPSLNIEHFPVWCKTGIKECGQSILRPFKIKA